jgi:hypothetical protein
MHSKLINKNKIIIKVVDSNSLSVLSLYYVSKAQEQYCTICLSFYNINLIVACTIISVDNLLVLFLITYLIKQANNINIDTLERVGSLVR